MILLTNDFKAQQSIMLFSVQMFLKIGVPEVVVAPVSLKVTVVRELLAALPPSLATKTGEGAGTHIVIAWGSPDPKSSVSIIWLFLQPFKSSITLMLPSQCSKIILDLLSLQFSQIDQRPLPTS